MPKRNTGNALTLAVCDALRDVIGTYGIAVICADEPDTMVGARRGSPLIIGIGDGENFLASDANAIVAHTRKVVYLNDYDVATITRDRFDVQNLGTDTANVQISKIEFAAQDAERGEYEHFMLKEIFEQPRTVENALRGRVDIENATARFGGLNMTPAELRSVDRLSSSPPAAPSWHAALVGAIFDRGNGRTCRWKSNSRTNCCYRGACRSSATPSCWSSRNPAKPRTRSLPCAKPSAAATKHWPSSMSSASTHCARI